MSGEWSEAERVSVRRFCTSSGFKSGLSPWNRGVLEASDDPRLRVLVELIDVTSEISAWPTAVAQSLLHDDEEIALDQIRRIRDVLGATDCALEDYVRGHSCDV